MHQVGAAPTVVRRPTDLQSAPLLIWLLMREAMDVRSAALRPQACKARVLLLSLCALVRKK